MGALARTLPNLPSDLKITVLTSTSLLPSKPSPRRAMFLSNIDQVLNFSVETFHFFKANAEYPVDTAIERLRSALQELLVTYDFLAGRLRFNPEEGRLEIDCNDKGVGFVVAESEMAISDIGELEYPNPAFRQLALAAAPEDGVKMEEQPLIAFQVTSFKCGGFALGISNNHTTSDGLSFEIFLKNLASLAGNYPLQLLPHTDRRLLAARSPPRITSPHPELMQLDAPSAYPPPATLLDATAHKLHFRLFRLTSADISSLKHKAAISISCNADGLPSRSGAITGFNVVTAHLWRCKALSSSLPIDPDKPFTVLYAVDIRRRLRPPLPPTYTGNAVLSAYASATRRELAEGSFGWAVGKVAEGAMRMDDEYARSVVDWGQIHKGFPRGDVFVSSWWRLGYAEVEFPWGRPVYSCPTAHPQRDIVLLFPNIRGASEGVNVLVSLPPDDMKRFEENFLKFMMA